MFVALQGFMNMKPELYLDTARVRESVLQMATLVGCPVEGRKNETEILVVHEEKEIQKEEHGQ